MSITVRAAFVEVVETLEELEEEKDMATSAFAAVCQKITDLEGPCLDRNCYSGRGGYSDKDRVEAIERGSQLIEFLGLDPKAVMVKGKTWTEIVQKGSTEGCFGLISLTNIVLPLMAKQKENKEPVLKSTARVYQVIRRKKSTNALCHYVKDPIFHKEEEAKKWAEEWEQNHSDEKVCVERIFIEK